MYSYYPRGGPVASDPALPSEWDATLVSYADPNPDAQPQIALIICVTKIQVTSNVSIGECPYQVEGPVPLPTIPGDESDTEPDFIVGVYPAIHYFTVITAKTGKVIAQFLLPGDDTPDHSCPSVSEDISSDTQVAQGIRPQTFNDRVGPFITATVP